MRSSLGSGIYCIEEQTHPKIDLERIIYEPLEGSECANHNDPNAQAVPKTSEADVTVNARYCCDGRFPS